MQNDRPFSPHNPFQGSLRPEQSYNKKPPVQEDTLKHENLQVERKSFSFTLKENPRGRFLRISEEAKGKRNSIIIPATGLEEFKKMFDAVTGGVEAPRPDEGKKATD